MLAPLAGFSDAALRQICSLQGADLCYTEMVSAKGLLYDSQRTASLLLIPPAQAAAKFKAVQLFGSEPEIFAAVLESSPLLAPFEIVDINMGCPVHKVVRAGEGSALMKDLKRAGAIIEAVCKAAPDKLVTAKIRAGWNASSINAVEAAQVLEESGAHAVTVHARTRDQFYAGECDYNLVARVREAVKIPVIVSGGIVCGDSYNRIRKATGCSSVMIGRGSLGTDLFARLKNLTARAGQGDGGVLHPQLTKEVPKIIPTKEKPKITGTDLCASATHPRTSVSSLFLEHLGYLREYYGEHYAFTNIRKFTPYYFKGLEGARQLRARINTASGTAQIEKILGDL